MGNLIKWKSIDSESTYNQTRIYRATSETGTFTLLATQTSITDTSYYDPTGGTSHWYKIDFYDTTNAVASSLSTAIQGGTFTGYCTVEDVRNITNLTTNDVTDSKLACLIEYCGQQLNSQINQYFEEEAISYISPEKSNNLSGTTFYTKNFPLGDTTGDSAVTVADIKVYSHASDGTKTELAVSSIIANTGQFVLSAAPAASIIGLTTTYNKSSLSVSDPHPLIRDACALLTASWAYTKINVGKAPRWRMGSTQIYRDMDSFNTYYTRYIRLLDQINNRDVIQVVTGDKLI